jgi:LacI family transcriptional regulator
MIQGNYDMQSGYEGMKALLRLKQPPTAVFCSNDDMAIGAMNAAFESGLNVPNDISIIGFDDIELAKYTTPSLTTVKRPIEKISMTGAEAVLSLMNKDDKNMLQNKVLINTELMVRQSVKSRSSM